MKIVIDTNVLFSALYNRQSIPRNLVQMGVAEDLLLYAPDRVQAEIERVLRGKLEMNEEETERVRGGLPVTWIPHKEYESFMPDALKAMRDSDDAPLVAVAVLVGGDIVSGDGAFHPLSNPLVRTWRPRDLLQVLQKE